MKRSQARILGMGLACGLLFSVWAQAGPSKLQEMPADAEQTAGALHEVWDGGLPQPGTPVTVEQPIAQGLGREALHQTVETLSSEVMEGRAPMSKGSRLSREYIIARMKAYGVQPGGKDGGYIQPVKKKLLGYRIGNNVIGAVTGNKKPEECLYVDAHYDHWGKAGGKIQPGANDNASGVAVMLEMGRILSSLKPDRTVVFLASDYEEGALLPMFGGLKGANYQVKKPFCAKDRIKGAVVLDMVGGPFVPGLKPQLFLIGSESNQATYDLARSLAENEDQTLPIRQLGVYAIEPLGRLAPRADYGAYRKIGVPFIFATSGIAPEYHSEADTIEKLDFSFMEKAGSEILKIILRMSSESFQPATSASGDDVIDWDRELATAEQIIDAVSSLENMPEDKASYLKKLRTLREELRAQPNLGNGQKEELKKKIRKAVITIMKMNGSLRVWEHIYRTHNVPQWDQGPENP